MAYLTCNQRFESLYGATKAEIVGKTDHDFVDKDFAECFRRHDLAAIAAGKPSINEEELTFADGHRELAQTIKTPMHDGRGRLIGVLGLARDITSLRAAEDLQKAQTAFLESVARGASLSDTLSMLLRAVEQRMPEVLTSVLVLDENGQHLRHGAATKLPPEYSAAIDSMSIGPAAGSCGTAAWRKEPVFVENTLTDPLWADFRELATKHDLHACWSMPILGSEGSVLGTLAWYSGRTGLPTEDQVRVMELSSNAASIAIGRHIEQRQLHESHERIRAFIETLPDAVFMKDGRGRWQMINQAAARLFRVEGTEWFGKTDAELAAIQPNFAAAHRVCNGADEVAWQARAMRIGQETLTAENGELRVFEVRKVPIFEADGSRKLMVTISRDVTERERTADTLRKLSLAVEQSPNSVLIADLEGRIEYVNTAFSASSGFDRDEVVGLNATFFGTELTPPETFASLWAALRTGAAWHGEFVNRRRDGGIYIDMASVVPIRQSDGQITHYLSIQEDVTEKRRTQS